MLILSCQNPMSESKPTMGKYNTPDDALTYDEEIEMEPPRTGEPPPPPPIIEEVPDEEIEEHFFEKGSKIIKNGHMNFEVDKLEIAKVKIDTFLSGCHGYYESEQYNSYGNRISYSLRLRIPNTKFDSLVNLLEQGVGNLKSKNVTATDVTEEYVDLSIRLDNNLAYLKQYKEILIRAKSVKEILEVQDKIRRIEEEIDSKKGRLKFLDDKVKYSTLQLELSELITTEISNKPNFGRRIVNAFNNGVQGFLSFIVGLVNQWPFLILIFLIFLGRKPILDKLRRRSTPHNKP